MLNNRKWKRRAAAVCLGLSVFVFFEALCRITGWGTESSAAGNFTEFNDTRPLFRLSDNQQTWQVAENHRLYFSEESFPAKKRQNEFRIFVFGGSTVQGRPFSIPTSFTTFLEIGLRQANPNTTWEVVNCGGISYASYRVLPIVKECLQYKPDLYIVCTGHNEFLECITYANVKSPHSLLASGYSWLNKLNSFHLAEQTWQHLSTTSATAQPTVSISMPQEVDAMLDHKGGLDAYQRSALHADHIDGEFRNNLQKMVNVAQAAKVPLMFISPASNLRDCPPFKSEFLATTNVQTQLNIVKMIRDAVETLPSNSSKAVQLLQSATENDSAFALSWYQLGHALVAANRVDEAAMAFAQARDEDVCPLRMTSQLSATLRAVADENHITRLDADTLLQGKSRNKIVGNAVLVDHVHPSFGSHRDIAEALVETMAHHNWIKVENAGWKSAARIDFENHLQSLDNIYFLSGRRTLETLRIWTQGRGDGAALETPAP